MPKRCLLILLLALASLLAGLDAPSADAARPPYSPRAGAVVPTPPLLRWRAVSRARYYNVQLYRGNRKILSAWPRRARFQVRRSWSFRGRRYALRPAFYRWYVWPNYGRRYGAVRVRTFFGFGRRPANVSPPVVVGPVQEGATLSALPGSWTGMPPPRFSYQWNRCNGAGACGAIPGATSPTYQIGPADIDGALQVVVTGSNFARSVAAASATTSVVLPAAPQNVSPPVLAGRPQQGEVLVAVNGSWTSARPVAYAFRWERCDLNGQRCGAVPGAVGQAYTLGPADFERVVRVIVTAANAGGQAAAISLASPAIGRVYTGTSRNDVLRGSRGADVIRALAGEDTISGGAGNDTIVGGPGADRMTGGSGDDAVDARDGNVDAVSCHDGSDRVTADRRDRVDRSCESVERR